MRRLWVPQDQPRPSVRGRARKHRGEMLSARAQAARNRYQGPTAVSPAGRRCVLCVLPGGKAMLLDPSGGSRLTQSPGDEASDFKMAPGRRPTGDSSGSCSPAAAAPRMRAGEYLNPVSPAILVKRTCLTVENGERDIRPEQGCFNSDKISPNTRPDPFRESPSSAGRLETPPREEKAQSPPRWSMASATYTGCGLAVPLGTAVPPPSPRPHLLS